MGSGNRNEKEWVIEMDVVGMGWVNGMGDLRAGSGNRDEKEWVVEIGAGNRLGLKGREWARGSRDGMGCLNR